MNLTLCCKKKYFIVFVLLLSAVEAQARDVYVKLSSSGNYAIGITQGYLVMTDSEGRLANLGDSTTIKVSGNYASIMGNNFMLPVKITGEGFLKFNGRTYRGSFLLTRRGGLLNVLDVEQYLYGVLPAEVGASWPDEALRAQAISARTYVIKQSMTRADRGYDVVDTDADQVYKGAGVETDKTNRAVMSTAGEILTYGNEIAYTYFHSDSGGHTANIADVWGNGIPYLTGVPEVVNYKSPVSTWNARFSASKIQSVVKKITGADIGTIKEIQVSEVDEGGRAVMMNFIGSKGTKTIRASQFRTNLDPRTLKSTMLTPSGGAFNVNNDLTPSGLVSQKSQPQKTETSNGMTFNEEQELAELISEGVFTSTELVDMLTNADKKKSYYQIGLGRSTKSRKPAQSKTPAQPKTEKPKSKYGYSIEKSGNEFVFYGRGWGHGVGLSQWGAMAMAEQGYKAEDILMHYYPGTTVRKFK